MIPGPHFILLGDNAVSQTGQAVVAAHKKQADFQSGIKQMHL
jgi:hypothetical protein